MDYQEGEIELTYCSSFGGVKLQYHYLRLSDGEKGGWATQARRVGTPRQRKKVNYLSKPNHSRGPKTETKEKTIMSLRAELPSESKKNRGHDYRNF